MTIKPPPGPGSWEYDPKTGEYKLSEPPTSLQIEPPPPPAVEPAPEPAPSEPEPAPAPTKSKK